MKVQTSRILLFSGIVSAFLSCFCGTSAWSQNTVAQPPSGQLEIDQFKPFPTFDGVKRVYVHVHSSGADSPKHQSELPAPLRTENLEALLMELYGQRFSSTNCTKKLEDTSSLVSPKHKYGCDDQPVVLVKDIDYRTPQAEEARAQPGSLNVELQIFFDMSLKPAVAALYLVQDRSDPEILTKFEISFPYTIPLNLDEQELHKRLFQYIRWKIH